MRFLNFYSSNRAFKNTTVYFTAITFLTSCGLILRESMVTANQLPWFSIGCFVFAGVLFILALPSLKLQGKLTDEHINPIALKIIKILFCLYFLYSSVYFLLRFTKFYESASGESLPAVFLILALLAIVVYAAHKGMKVVFRCGIIIAFLVLLTYSLIFMGSAVHIDIDNLKDIDFTDFSGIGSAFGIVGGLTFLLPVFTTVKTEEKGKFKSLAIFFGASVLLIILTVILAAAALDVWGGLRDYPVFSLARVSKISILRGIDGMMFALFSAEIFVLLSLFTVCAKKSFQPMKSIGFVIVFAACVAAISILFVCFDFYRDIIFSDISAVSLNIVFGFLIPLIFLVTKGRKRA